MICKNCGNETGHYAQHVNAQGCRNAAAAIEADRRIAALRAQVRFRNALQNLQEGDLVEHKNGGTYVVIRSASPDRPAIAMRSIAVTDPSDWVQIFPGFFSPSIT